MRFPSLLLLALLPLAACSAREDHDDDDDGDIQFDATDWSAALDSRANSGVRGSASVRSVGLGGEAGTSTATAVLTGATPGSRHPWHVHGGTCSSGGAIIGNAGDYPLLEVGVDGSARASAGISAGMIDESRYHVNVHRSAADLTVIACGNLED